MNELQVYKKILDFKPNRSVTPLDLPIKLFLEFAIELSNPLCDIINTSLQQCKIPLGWKDSFVTPCPKTTAPTTFTELRPLTLTQLASLLCESFVTEWAYKDISQNIDPQQFGNVKSASTTHCLVNLLHYIYSELEKRKTSVLITLIDFSKAFDLVDHTTVIKKALNCGVRECLVPWIADFLTNRRQAVRYQGVTSPFLSLTCGIPQGTKLGPLGFLILINDALQHTPQRWKYVDDTTLATSLNNTNPDYSTTQSSLDSLSTWAEQNHVTINSQKTLLLHFDFSITPTPQPSLSLAGHTLRTVNTAKLLGITLDDRLDWHAHTQKTVQSASYRLYMLRRLRSCGMQPTELAQIYRTFILPKLTYASPAWSSSLSATQLSRLERVQKRAMRIIYSNNYTNYEQALLNVGLPKLADHYNTLLLKFGHKLLKDPRHRHFLPPPAPPPTQFTRHTNKLVPFQTGRERFRLSAIPLITKWINEPPPWALNLPVPPIAPPQ